MKKYVSVVVSIILLVAIGMVLSKNKEPSNATPWISTGTGFSSMIPPNNISSNIIIKDGIQYITVDAKGGYSPRKTTAKAGVPTKLIVKTDETYDCSSSLLIRSINYRSMLPATGETKIDIPEKKPGEHFEATCGMGMYSFDILFE